MAPPLSGDWDNDAHFGELVPPLDAEGRLLQ